MQQNDGGALFQETTRALKGLGFETCITARDKHHEGLSIRSPQANKQKITAIEKATDPSDSDLIAAT